MFAGPAGIGYVQPVLGAALAVIVVTITAAVCMILLITILRGTPETTERVFRLLRMISGRAEPPSPRGNAPIVGARSPDHFQGQSERLHERTR